MSPARRVRTRTQPCTAEQARKRLADARKFLELRRRRIGRDVI